MSWVVFARGGCRFYIGNRTGKARGEEVFSGEVMVWLILLVYFFLLGEGFEPGLFSS